MKVAEPPQAKNTADIIPWDLTDWIDSPILLTWISEEIETLDWQNPTVQLLLQKHPNFHPKELLALLVYAYTTRVYEADLVCDLVESDPHVGRILNNAIVNPGMISRFRRENRGILRWLIMKVFKRAFWHQYQVPASDFIPAGLKQYFAQAANARLDLAKHLELSSPN